MQQKTNKSIVFQDLAGSLCPPSEKSAHASPCYAQDHFCNTQVPWNSASQLPKTRKIKSPNLIVSTTKSGTGSGAPLLQAQSLV